MIVMVCPKCGSELEALVYTTYPPIHAYRCRNCGWEHEERTNITQVPIRTVERKPQTNYERLISKTPEEMAKWLAAIVDEVTCDSWLDWLKSPVEDAT